MIQIKLIDLTGERFGRLTVLERDTNQDQSRSVYWKCLCDCGNEVSVRSRSLRNGDTKSCGCLQQETRSQTGKRNKKHECQDRKLQAIWRTMKHRCSSPKHNRYRNYGGKNIHVCEEWQDFDVFAQWALSHGYQHGLTIDRINVNSSYTPDNCRFVTSKEQANNKTTNKWVEYNGEKYTVAKLADKIGMKYTTLNERLRHGWSIDDAVSIPVKPWNRA